MARRKKEIAPEAKAMDKMMIIMEQADKLWGDGQPFDLVRVETRIGTNNSTVIEGMIASGRDYLWAKAHIDHGEFMALVDRTASSYTYVNNCMRFAEMYPNSPPVVNLGVRKTRALATLDKPIVEKYLSGGPLGDIPHDDVSEMPVSELEAEVRRLRKEMNEKVDSLEAVIKKKSAKIADLECEIRTGDQQTKEKKAEKALQKYRDPIIDNLLVATERIKRATDAIDEAQKIPHVPFEALEQLIEPWKESFSVFLEAAEDFSDAFNNIHVDKGRG